MENLFIKNKPIKDTKVVVAMSGGVDSSVVAVMLHKKGYQVIGLTMQLYDQSITLERKGACCAGKDIYDAKNVAEKFGFPHYVLNYEDVFRQEVMEDFADSYLRGYTPIPCVKCNQSVKFRDMFKMAKDLGADALATGHYVQRKVINGVTQLHKAIDPNKDQSYFLFSTTKEQLEYIFFPLGGLHKQQTRGLAQEYGLEIADKPDSQDICFVPNGSYTSVIEKLRPNAFIAGDIVHIDGKLLGHHRGIAYYTRGQRRGLGISSSDPLYVVRTDATTNQVIVGPESALAESVVYVSELNWLGSEDKEELKNGLKVSVKLRSTTNPTSATIYLEENNSLKVLLEEPQRAITPGQACVIYDGERILGGGWIMNMN